MLSPPGHISNAEPASTQEWHLRPEQDRNRLSPSSDGAYHTDFPGAGFDFDNWNTYPESMPFPYAALSRPRTPMYGMGDESPGT